MSSDSSRDSVHFTGASRSQAASAVCAWLLMSSLPPNAPPFDTSSTVTCVCGRCRAPTRSGRGRPTRPGRRSTRAARRRGCGHGERRLRLEEGVLDALGLEHLVHACARWRRARRRRRRGRTPNATARCRRAPTPRSSASVERGDRVGDRRSTSVARPRRARPPARAVARSSATTMRQHVAEVGRAAADRDHHRPVLVDDADAQLAGDVGRGEHAPRRPGTRPPRSVSIAHAHRRGRDRRGAARRAACRARAGRRRSALVAERERRRPGTCCRSIRRPPPSGCRLERRRPWRAASTASRIFT